MSGFKSSLDDLEAIRKRREELFPKSGLRPEEPFEQPEEPFEATEVPLADEYYGCSPSQTALYILREWNILKAKRLKNAERDREAFLDLYR